MNKKDILIQQQFCAINRTQTRNICRLILYISGRFSEVVFRRFSSAIVAPLQN